MSYEEYGDRVGRRGGRLLWRAVIGAEYQTMYEGPEEEMMSWAELYAQKYGVRNTLIGSEGCAKSCVAGEKSSRGWPVRF